MGISHDKEKSAVVAPHLKKYNLTYPVLLGDVSVVVSYISGVRHRRQNSISLTSF